MLEYLEYQYLYDYCKLTQADQKLRMVKVEQHLVKCSTQLVSEQCSALD